MNATAKQGTPDATRHSTSQTPIRKTLEAWESFKREWRDRLSAHRDTFGRRMTEQEMVACIGQLFRVCDHVCGLLDHIHWPATDRARSLRSDERAFEQAARHLRTEYLQPGAGVGLAWGLLEGALRLERTWRGNDYYAGIGVDLSAFFGAELDAALAVVRNDHLARAGSKESAP